MIRDIIKIDEDLCNGCGECVPNCHEGALQIIDGKVRMVSELMCDGLGACIGHCPVGALTIEKREAPAYDEVETIKEMISKGKNTIIAHLKHLKEHGEVKFLHEGVSYLTSVQDSLPFDLQEVKAAVHNASNPKLIEKMSHSEPAKTEACGCPGSKTQSFTVNLPSSATGSIASQLTHWPVQLHLINPLAQFFQGADMLIAADCVAFSLGGFHQNYLKGKTLAIACPKLDANQDIYATKIKTLIDESRINTLTVMIMEVPCCGGLLRMVQSAIAEASRKIPLKLVIVSTRGEILKEDWI